MSTRIEQPYVMYSTEVIQISTFQEGFFSTCCVKDSSVKTGNARFEGFIIDLVDAIARDLNFTVEYLLAENVR